jgi:hypothetical protein
MDITTAHIYFLIHFQAQLEGWKCQQEILKMSKLVYELIK